MVTEQPRIDLPFANERDRDRGEVNHWNVKQVIEERHPSKYRRHLAIITPIHGTMTKRTSSGGPEEPSGTAPPKYLKVLNF